jgi:nitrogen fixation protein NifB
MEGKDIDYRAARENRARERIHRMSRSATQSGNTLVQLKPLRRHAPGVTPRPVLMAVASKGGGLINQHFGHAREFLVYEASTEGVRLIGHRNTERYCAGADDCGETETVLAGTIRALEGCEVVLCAKIGFEPWGQLQAAGIQPNSERALEPIEPAVMSVYQELLDGGGLDTTLPGRISA